MRTMIRWGVWGGLAIGLVVVALHGVLPPLFTGEDAVQAALSAALIVVGLGQAVAGYVFVIDGVLIGAGDGRWLAWGQVISLVLYIPIVLALRGGPSDSAVVDIVVLWLAFTFWMAIRGVVLGWRARRTRGWSPAPDDPPEREVTVPREASSGIHLIGRMPLR